MTDNLSDIVLLEQAYSGDAGSSGGKARLSVRERDSAEREDRDVRFAGLFEDCQAGGLGPWRIFLFKHRREDGERRAVC